MDYVEMKWFTVACFLIHSLNAFEYEGCVSPQYLELYQRGTIQCTFAEEFFGIYWYNSTETVKEKPILNFKGSTKSGIGFTTGEFDIHPNGSLIINNVSIHHEHNFTVVKLHSREEIPSHYIIEVYATGQPDQDFPLIENCDGHSRACFLQADDTTQLRCVVRDVRPKVSLSWTVRKSSDDVQITSEVTLVYDSVRYTSHAAANATFENTSFLQLFICKSISEPSMLGFSESYVLVEKSQSNFSSLELVTRYFKRGSKMELLCDKGDISFLAWKVISKTGDEYEDKVVAIYINEETYEVYSDDFKVGRKGSLIASEVEVGHEGTYACVYGNGFTDGKFLHEVVVYVDPMPPYLMIGGCEGERYCLLHLGNQGMLTCFVNGIRPEVQLLIRPLYESSPDVISFYDQKTSITNNGDTFDVTLTTHFSASNPQSNRIAVECKASGPNADLFDLSLKIDLWVLTDKENTSHSNRPVDGTEDAPNGQLLMILWLLPVLLILGVVTAAFLKVFRRRRRGKIDEAIHVDEVIPMYGNNYRQESDPSYTDKKKILIGELKIKYQNLYNKVQPIPYIKEKLYCVNSIFIEGDIEMKVFKGNSEIWESANTYQTVLTDTLTGSRRSILQGDAGYGKSTFTLQLAYEWCKEIKSPLNDVEILILLRLRQFGKTSSIYEAVRQFLLPKDSTLSEKDIEDIFQRTKSILIILDGYDEYPNEDDDTDVALIIKRDMFQQIPVILTTRSCCLPKDYPPQTKHFRLNGFNETSRQRYIEKVVVRADDEMVKRIKHRLIENPVLNDLCQVPLFFVMFAHMTYERDEFQNFNSVTSFFSYMISCFHSHMRNKIKDKTELDKFQELEADHCLLDKFAFETLCAERKRLVWGKEDLIRYIGRSSYEHYLKIGILVEEEVLDRDNGPGLFQYKTEVKFYHNIFVEWYAAHLLSEYAASEGVQYLRKALKHLGPFEYHYVYRFACGLQPKAADNILEYLKSIIEGQEFSVLCKLEQIGKVEKITDTVAYLSSGVVPLVNKNNRLQLRSTIQILEIASSNAIPIPCVSIENSFQSVDCVTWNISLGSGQFLSNLSSMEELRFYEMGRELKAQEVEEIFKFASQCLSLKTLRFDSCLLPWSITTKKNPADINSNEITVIWNPIGKWYRWISEVECWEDRYESVAISLNEYEAEVERFRKEWSHTHWQESTNEERPPVTSVPKTKDEDRIIVKSPKNCEN